MVIGESHTRNPDKIERQGADIFVRINPSPGGNLSSLLVDLAGLRLGRRMRKDSIEVGTSPDRLLPLLSRRGCWDCCFLGDSES
jgi:hypothetical protein